MVADVVQLVRMKPEERASISVSKKTHAELMKYCAQLSMQTGESQTQDSVISALLNEAKTRSAPETPETPAIPKDMVRVRFLIFTLAALWIALAILGALFAAHILM
ncbi:MAG: hypothetical protein ACXV5K_11880 [Halobacteriota archaeon]